MEKRTQARELAADAQDLAAATDGNSPEERERRLREIHGLPPIPPEDSARTDELRESSIHCPQTPDPESQTPDPVKPGKTR